VEATLEVCSPADAKPTRNHLFTSANAKEMAARGNAAKARAKRQREENIAKANAIATLPPDEIYKNRRLVRVRKQLERLDDMMERERDPQKLDRLASAQARLSVQEFALAGRPMPGSRRPAREKPARRPCFVEPLDAE
jgi:hypothetical protein